MLDPHLPLRHPRFVRSTLTVVPILILAFGAMAGCAWIGGIEEITLVEADAGPGDGGSEDATVDGPGSCELPSEGDAFVRLGHLVPESAGYDFCIRPSGADSWQDVQPVLASGGTACPDGLRYRDVTVAFRVEPGTHDVRLVDAGSDACTEPQGEITGIQTKDNRVTTVLAFEGDGGTPVVRDLPESQPSFNRTQMRFIHATVGHDALDCGLTDSIRLPAAVVSPVFRDIPFGEASPAGTSDLGSIDDNGYVVYTFGGSTLRFGAAEPESTDALATMTARFALNSSHTLFAIGRVGDATYPPSLWSCNEGTSSDGILTTCGDPLDLNVEVFSTQLTDLFTPLYRERIDVVRDALTKSTETGVLCINETRSPDNLDHILDAVEDIYPHRIAAHTLSPSDSDLTDQEGNLPEPYTTPACTGEAGTAFQTLMDCVDANCTQDDGSGHRFIDSGNVAADCVGTPCEDEAFELVLNSGEQGQPCWMCALTQMAGEETTEWVRQACTGDPEARFAYRGSTGLAILSKYPIGDAKHWLLPSTGWQRGLLHAPIELPNGVPLDFYCGDLTLPVAGGVIPYVGHYGGSSKGDAQWVAEQKLQAQRVVSIIEQQSGGSGTRVVLATTAYAGPEYMDGSTRVLAAQSPEVYSVLESAFRPLVPPGYEPACTQCLDNPVLSGLEASDLPAADAWTSHLLGLGFGADAVKETRTTFTEASYEVSDSGETRSITPSSQYGLLSVVRVTQ